MEIETNRFVLITAFILSAIAACTSSCNIVKDNIGPPLIQGLTLDNYPKVDGSTSTEPLNAIIACRLLGIDYEWIWNNNIRTVEPSLNKKENSEKFRRLIKSSQTHQAFVNLINKEADLILSARTISPDEKAGADAARVSLIETPIALDAFVFIVNPDNPIESLTTTQAQGIYTGTITNWKEVGGNDAQIDPYVRNANSGSQKLMETLVMKDLQIKEFDENRSELIFSMAGALDWVSRDTDSICYTVYYYKEYIASHGRGAKSIAINGIYPDRGTISDKSYPYTAPVYAVIRSDLDKSSKAYIIYEWLQTEAGKQVINESGYVPYY
jgi:phosphate transport system substrate-binding protein